ncbi:MAG: MscS Mechanosensitive ion channel [Proteobacteria bacterium]|nr:MscS Mechanosensitive ion channel [Pseudomonadota bacterium]
MISRRLSILWLFVALAVTAPFRIAASDIEGGVSAAHAEVEVAEAPVLIDGRVLFRVRGVSAYPAERRAAAIEDRIEGVARDPEFQKDMLQAVESAETTRIMAGDRMIMMVLDADAEIEGVRRQELATALAQRIREAIDDYRRQRTPEMLLQDGLYAAVATIVLVSVLALVVWIGRRLAVLMERRLHRHIHALGIQSFEIVRAERLWAALRGALGAGRALAILAIAIAYLHYVLALFPWTRNSANRLLDYLISPLVKIGQAIAADIPDLIFLAVLVVIVHYVLKLTRFFFDAVAGGSVKLAGFQPEWARPTFNIARVAIIAFALVVAYPYIPGSQSAAFKGISLFLGVVFSLGSSSIIANTIAGYALIYRRAFKLGDRVKIAEMMGDVAEMRVQVTHLRSLKNEEIIVPNSMILTSHVVNYSSLAREQGLILHTTVGIGYETPWRQVEAMLLMAAERTAGLLQEPRPFILQQALGDFAVNYELNVHCDDASRMMALYTDLHRNILDVFNEYDVQIMTPAYVADPQQSKVVPKEQWFAAPAQREDG